MTERYEKSRTYLVNLLRAYRNKPIVVKLNEDGEEIKIIASTFVKTQLDHIKLDFPYEKVKERCPLLFNNKLNLRQLTILFHEAVFELESAYIEMLNDAPEADGYAYMIQKWITNKRIWLKTIYHGYDLCAIIPFPEQVEKRNLLDTIEHTEDNEEVIAFLNDIGIYAISNPIDLNTVLWHLMANLRSFDKNLADVLFEISMDKGPTLKFISSYKKTFNDVVSLLQQRKDKKKEEIIDSHVNSLKEELQSVKDELKMTRKTCAEMVQKDKYHKVGNSLIRSLLNPQSTLYKAFNFEHETVREEYIKWFDKAQKRIGDSRIRTLKKHWRFSDEAWKEFYNLLERHNEKYKVDEDEGDTKD